MNPYRYVLTKTIQPSLFERLLRYLTRFQFARRRLGGHWERRWFPSRYFDEHDRWGDWEQKDDCELRKSPHVCGVPACDFGEGECEDYEP